MELDGIIKFAKLIHDFQNVERVIWLKGREHPENDVEHSYQLAMMGWYIISAYKLPLDADKIIKYSLLHDLVEVYAGDTYIFDKDPTQHTSKIEREHEALERLKIEFNEFPEMALVITEYESQQDEESQFVYALDKVLGPLNIYMDNGRAWHKKGVTFQMLLDNKLPRVAKHPAVKRYFDQLVKILEKEQHMFPKQENEDEKI